MKAIFVYIWARIGKSLICTSQGSNHFTWTPPLPQKIGKCIKKTKKTTNPSQNFFFYFNRNKKFGKYIKKIKKTTNPSQNFFFYFNRNKKLQIWLEKKCCVFFGSILEKKGGF